MITILAVLFALLGVLILPRFTALIVLGFLFGGYWWIIFGLLALLGFVRNLLVLFCPRFIRMRE